MAEACFEGAQASKSYNSKHVCLPCAHYHDWSYCLPVSCPPGTQDLQVVLYLMSMSIFHRNFLQLSSPKSQLGKEQRAKTFTQMNSWTTAYSFCFSKVKTNCKNDAVVQRSISLFFYCEEKTIFCGYSGQFNTVKCIPCIYIYIYIYIGGFFAASGPVPQHLSILTNPDFIYLSAKMSKIHASLAIIFPFSASKHLFLFFPRSPPSVSCPSLLLLCTAKHHYWSLPKHKLKIYPVVICCTVPSIIGGAWQRLHTREEVLEQEAESRTFTRNKKLVTIIYGSCWDT